MPDFEFPAIMMVEAATEDEAWGIATGPGRQPWGAAGLKLPAGRQHDRVYTNTAGRREADRRRLQRRDRRLGGIVGECTRLRVRPVWVPEPRLCR